MADLNPKHVANEIQTMLKEAQPFFPAECCIYRVPHEIHKLNENAYTPKVVSIGPFHRGDARLLKMEGQKQIYCQKFLERSEKSLDQLVYCCAQELEPKARRSYSENIGLSEEEFVKVILVDCGFIIELFLRYHLKQWTADDAISLTSWLRSDIRLDLLLLENQVPFSVLEDLYNLAFATRLNGEHPSFFKLALNYFESFNDAKAINFLDTVSVKHFTDLLRSFYLQPSKISRSRGDKLLTHLYSANELCESGVKFKVNKTSHCLLDLRFSGSTLEIPQIKVEDSTEIVLRNMVAVEQCLYPNQSYITDYVAVLYFLVNTDKDVDFLVKKGIIVNWLGDSKEVAKLFNGLWKNITQENFNVDHLGVCQELNAYYKHPVHSRMATLKRDYCNTPWKTAASIAGIVLLLFSVTQTIITVLSKFHVGVFAES